MTSPFIWLQHALPHHLVSRGAGKIASSEVPFLKNLLIRRFIDAYDVDMSEAARGVDEYKSFNDFFTRELKPGMRPLADASAHILSPAFLRGLAATNSCAWCRITRRCRTGSTRSPRA